jgi:hypothetical protein
MPKRCSVGARFKQYGVFFDNLFQDVPHDWRAGFDFLLGRFDVVAMPMASRAREDEGLEQLKRHQLRQTALVQLQGWAHVITERPE